ncbi:MAG: hypothetical protein R3182_01260, partial [Draconibacterium sp.]|nr:hypothetical protein [Draconibacterium sp.]
MKRSLTTKDIKELRNRCKMGYFISSLLLIFGIVIGITIYESYFDTNPNTINYQIAITIFLSALFLS